MSEHRIHILGGSGSGTTTLGAALSAGLSVPHFDTDTFFWLPSQPPFQAIRPVAERQARLHVALDSGPAWVLSGSLTGWGDFAMPRFTAAVLMTLSSSERLRRVRLREQTRYGARIEPGGDLHTQHTEFMAYAAAYDTGGVEVRSRLRHDLWVKDLSCPVLRLNGALSTADQVSAVLAKLPVQD